MLVVLIGFAFVSCKKEPVTPTPPTPQPIVVVPVESFKLVTVEGANITVDSIGYRNTDTGYTQVGSPPPLNIHCTGQDHNTVTLILDEPMLKTENCEITVYFTPNQGTKVFTVLLWKEGGDLCDSYGGQGGVQFEDGDVFVTNR